MLLSLLTQNFLADKTHDLFPQHPVFARLNWDEFATATKYPSQATDILAFHVPPKSASFIETSRSWHNQSYYPPHLRLVFSWLVFCGAQTFPDKALQSLPSGI